jgi:hypothetical protein
VTHQRHADEVVHGDFGDHGIDEVRDADGGQVPRSATSTGEIDGVYIAVEPGDERIPT